MVKMLTKRILWVLTLLMPMMLILTYCTKDNPIGTEREGDIATKVKQEWSKIDFGKELRQQINDSLNLQWVPQWTDVSQETKEGVTYTYVPLTHEVEGNDGQKASTRVTTNKQMYLLIKDDQVEKKFYLETFVREDEENNKSTKLMSDKPNRNGSLTLREINTDNVFSYTYSNGVGTASYYCTYQTECHWGSADVCNGGMVLAMTMSPVSEEPYRYPCPQPYEAGTCPGTQFNIVRSILVTYCSTGSTPPPAPPIPPVTEFHGIPTGVGWLGENIQSAVPVDTNVRKVANWCSNLDLATRRSFVEGFYDMMNDQPGSCAYTWVYKTMTNPQRPKRFQVCLDTRPGAHGAHYDPQLDVMYFGGTYYASFPELVQHEFFHFYQDNFYQGGIGQYSVNLGLPNIEFEQALFMDIAKKRLTVFNKGTDAQKAAYQGWINSITAGFTTAPKTYGDLGGRYFEFLNAWKALYPDYNKDTKTDLLPEAMLSAFSGSACY